MAGYTRETITGTPGERWTNNTQVARYQFVCALINTCGTCLQYHMQIGPHWPLPIHRGCRCTQRAVKPGSQAPHEFADFHKILDNLPHPEQVAAIGSSNFKLLKKGLATWQDIVTPSRVRDFREVVARKNLSLNELTGAGIKPQFARAAHAAVHTPGHDAAEAHRAELVGRIRQAGLTHDQLAKELATRLTARVRIAEGPSYTTRAGTVLPGIQAQRMPAVPGTGPAELARLLTAYQAAQRAKPAPREELLAAEPVRAAVESGSPGALASAIVEKEAEIQHLTHERAYLLDPAGKVIVHQEGTTPAEPAPWQPTPAHEFRTFAAPEPHPGGPAPTGTPNPYAGERWREWRERLSAEDQAAVMAGVPFAPIPGASSVAQRSHAWGQQHYKAWRESLPTEEQKALSEYMGKESRSVNRFHRRDTGATAPADTADLTRRLDSALARHPLPESVTVYRFMELRDVGLDISTIKPGMEFRDKGYTSTSLNPEHRQGAIPGERLEIRVPKGTEAGYLLAADDPQKATALAHELLLGRSANRFRVVEVRPETPDMERTVVLEVIPDAAKP